MLRKNFTAPFWCMLVLGVIASCMAVYGLQVIKTYAPTYVLSTLRTMSFFFLPAIMFVEAIMYWLVRYRNVYRSASWSHVLLFAFAYSTPFIKNVLFIFYDNFSPTADIASYVKYVNLVQIGVFWGVTILAHIFFVRLLIRSVSKQPDPLQGTGQAENMLDDVLR